MKIRRDFVTNSSSSSYIICFARIVDDAKADKIITKYDLPVYSAEDVNKEKNYYGELGASWCGAVIWNADKILKEHPDSKYVMIEDSCEAEYDDDGEPMYSYDFAQNDAINEITRANGFDNIEVAEGEGRDG